MRNSDNILKEEWEAVLLAGVFLLILLCLAMSFAGRESSSAFQPQPPPGRTTESARIMDAFAVLKNKEYRHPERNPFLFHIPHQPPVPPLPPQPEKLTQGKPADGKNAVGTPAETEKIPPETPPETPARGGFRLSRKRLTYLYSQPDSTGRTTAILKIRDADGKEMLHTPGTGDLLLGMTVLSIHSDQLKLLDAAGKQVAVPFGDAKNVTVQEKIR